MTNDRPASDSSVSTVFLRVERCIVSELRVFLLTPVMSDYHGDKMQRNGVMSGAA